MEVGALVAREPVVCGPETQVRDAAKQMLAEEVGSLAVLDGGRLVGLVTERDIVRVVASGSGPGGVTVADAMTSEPDTVESDVDTAEVAEWFLAAGYRHLPVTEDGRLVGVISMKDILLVSGTDDPVTASG